MPQKAKKITMPMIDDLDIIEPDSSVAKMSQSQMKAWQKSIKKIVESSEYQTAHNQIAAS